MVNMHFSRRNDLVRFFKQGLDLTTWLNTLFHVSHLLKCYENFLRIPSPSRCRYTPKVLKCLAKLDGDGAKLLAQNWNYGWHIFHIPTATEVEGGYVNPSQHKRLGQVRPCPANIC